MDKIKIGQMWLNTKGLQMVITRLDNEMVDFISRGYKNIKSYSCGRHYVEKNVFGNKWELIKEFDCWKKAISSTEFEADYTIRAKQSYKNRQKDKHIDELTQKLNLATTCLERCASNLVADPSDINQTLEELK